MDEPPSDHYRSRRLAVWCAAAVGAALFTPVPAIADVIERPAAQNTVQAAPARQAASPQPDVLADLLISAGMIGIGLSMGGLVIVTHLRRQY